MDTELIITAARSDVRKAAHAFNKTEIFEALRAFAKSVQGRGESIEHATVRAMNSFDEGRALKSAYELAAPAPLVVVAKTERGAASMRIDAMAQATRDKARTEGRTVPTMEAARIEVRRTNSDLAAQEQREGRGVGKAGTIIVVDPREVKVSVPGILEERDRAAAEMVESGESPDLQRARLKWWQQNPAKLALYQNARAAEIRQQGLDSGSPLPAA